jgi:anti-anti-sigma factor
MLDMLITRLGQLTIVEATGRIDSVNADQFLRALTDEYQRGRTRIVVDMAGVNFISGAGVHALKQFHGLSGTVRIAQPSLPVLEVLQIIGLDTVYDVYPSRIEAIQAITSVTNAHTHLELGWAADHRPGIEGAPFVPWIQRLTQRTWEMRDGGDWAAIYERSARDGIQTLLDAGTTTVGEISAMGVSIGPLLESGLKGVVYVEVAGADPARAEQRAAWVRGVIDEWRPKERNGMRVGLGIHAPYSTHPDLWRQLLDYARKEALPLSIHVAESHDEHEYLTRGKGAFADGFYEALSLPPIPVPRKTPIAYLEDLGALALRPLLAHAIHVSDDDIRRIKASGASVVHCPRSNLRLRCGRMPLEKYLAQGVPVYLGTDSLSSSPSLDVFDELEVAAALHYGKAQPEAIERMIHQPLPG